jgi:hypothetical protein
VGCLALQMVGNRINKSFTSDPVAAAKTAHAIADYDLPAGYTEQTAMDFVYYQLVIIGPGNNSDLPSFVLAQLSMKTSTSPENMQKQMQRAMEQQSNGQGSNMQVVERRQATIRGADTQIIISEGTTQDGQAIRQLSTVFPGKSGQAMLLISGPIDAWDQNLVDAFVQSIH